MSRDRHQSPTGSRTVAATIAALAVAVIAGVTYLSGPLGFFVVVGLFVGGVALARALLRK